MGITIHYKGKAKSLEAIDGVIGELEEIAKKLNWEHDIIDEEMKGELCPSWGYGFGYVPSEEEIEKEKIEFFPAMISIKCNGYFKIWESKYSEEIRNFFTKGQQPKFFVDTRKKGIWINVHPNCETLEFVFDLKTLELADYQQYDHTPNLIYGYNGLFCKTQYAGVKIHILVCRIIELTEKYIDYSDIYDEAGYYKTKNMQTATEAFCESSAMIKNLGKELEKMFAGKGVEIVTGMNL